MRKVCLAALALPVVAAAQDPLPYEWRRVSSTLTSGVFSLDGRYLAASGGGNSVIFDVERGAIASQDLTAMSDSVFAFDRTRNAFWYGKYRASATTGVALVRPLYEAVDAPTAITPDGRRVWTPAGMFSARDLSPLPSPGIASRVSRAAFANSRLVVDGPAVYDHLGELLWRARHPRSPFAVSPDGKTVFYVADTRVVAAEASTGRTRWVVQPPLALLDSLAVSGDGRTVYYVAEDLVTPYYRLRGLDAKTGAIRPGSAATDLPRIVAAGGGRVALTDSDPLDQGVGARALVAYTVDSETLRASDSRELLDESSSSVQGPTTFDGRPAWWEYAGTVRRVVIRSGAGWPVVRSFSSPGMVFAVTPDGKWAGSLMTEPNRTIFVLQSTLDGRVVGRFAPSPYGVARVFLTNDRVFLLVGSKYRAVEIGGDGSLRTIGEAKGLRSYGAAVLADGRRSVVVDANRNLVEVRDVVTGSLLGSVTRENLYYDIPQPLAGGGVVITLRDGIRRKEEVFAIGADHRLTSVGVTLPRENEFVRRVFTPDGERVWDGNSWRSVRTNAVLLTGVETLGRTSFVLSDSNTVLSGGDGLSAVYRIR